MGVPERAADRETVEAERRVPANPLSHEEYTPWGTALLLALYMVVLVVAWTLMYFVEFLGRGPHIFG